MLPGPVEEKKKRKKNRKQDLGLCTNGTGKVFFDFEPFKSLSILKAYDSILIQNCYCFEEDFA